MIEFELNGQKHSLPQSWGEVMTQDLPQILKVLISQADGKAYHRLLRIIMGFDEKAWQKNIGYFFEAGKVSEETKQYNAAAIYELVELLNWMWKIPLTRQPFPFIKVGKDKWFLPDEDFESMSWGELTDALIHYDVFVNQKVAGIKHLDLLVATLCRHKRKDNYLINQKWNGDLRVPYNSFLVARNAESLKLLDFETKMSVLLFFGGASKAAMDIYDLKAAGGDESAAEEYPGQSFVKNTHKMAEKGIFGSFEQTRARNCHDVLIFLEEDKKDIEEQIRLQKLRS